MMTSPEPQHAWLKRLVGEWSAEFECVMGPDQPVEKGKGVEVIRMVGDLWIVAEATGEMPGGCSMTSIMTVGYDPSKKKFVGTWIGSPMANLFVYEGDLKKEGGVDVLPLNTIGPSWEDPTKTARYQDVIELHSDSKRLLWSQVLDDSGKGTRFMTATYTRTK